MGTGTAPLLSLGRRQTQCSKGGGTMEVEAKSLEVPEGLLRAFMGMWRRTKG